MYGTCEKRENARICTSWNAEGTRSVQSKYKVKVNENKVPNPSKAERTRRQELDYIAQPHDCPSNVPGELALEASSNGLEAIS